MTTASESPDNRPDPSALRCRVTALAVLLLFVGAALAIPVYYETTTLWYKTGIERTMLQAGQYLGLLAFCLLYIQVVLSTRGRLLERGFGAAALLRWHRFNGIALVVLAAAHVGLVIVPEGVMNLPIGWKFWPEMIGAALFALLIVIAFTSQLRQQLGLDYRAWKVVHRPLGYLAVLLVSAHVLFVSDSFEHLLPRLYLIGSLALLTGWVAAVAWRRR